jgi:hypothetical protein
MAADKTAGTEPADRAVMLLQKVRGLMLECKAVTALLEAPANEESQAAAAERIAYGVLVGALEEGLGTTLSSTRWTCSGASARRPGSWGSNGSASRRASSGRGSPDGRADLGSGGRAAGWPFWCP